MIEELEKCCLLILKDWNAFGVLAIDHLKQFWEWVVETKNQYNTLNRY